MADRTAEWLRQADYDLETADFMLKGGRRFYAVFMAHLAVEKALKGLYRRKLGKTAPKIHNLIYLADEMGITLPVGQREFFIDLTSAHVATRYPDDLGKLQAAFTEARAARILSMAREAVTWVKTQL